MPGPLVDCAAVYISELYRLHFTSQLSVIFALLSALPQELRENHRNLADAGRHASIRGRLRDKEKRAIYAARFLKRRPGRSIESIGRGLFNDPAERGSGHWKKTELLLFVIRIRR